jgi:septal ring factor EnvC (AmiA/AmiB activator)
MKLDAQLQDKENEIDNANAEIKRLSDRVFDLEEELDREKEAAEQDREVWGRREEEFGEFIDALKEVRDILSFFAFCFLKEAISRRNLQLQRRILLRPTHYMSKLVKKRMRIVNVKKSLLGMRKI